MRHTRDLRQTCSHHTPTVCAHSLSLSIVVLMLSVTGCTTGEPDPSPTVTPTVTPTVSPTVTPTVSPTVTPTPTPEVLLDNGRLVSVSFGCTTLDGQACDPTTLNAKLGLATGEDPAAGQRQASEAASPCTVTYSDMDVFCLQQFYVYLSPDNWYQLLFEAEGIDPDGCVVYPYAALSTNAFLLSPLDDKLSKSLPVRVDNGLKIKTCGTTASASSESCPGITAEAGEEAVSLSAYPQSEQYDDEQTLLGLCAYEWQGQSRSSGGWPDYRCIHPDNNAGLGRFVLSYAAFQQERPERLTVVCPNKDRTIHLWAQVRFPVASRSSEGKAASYYVYQDEDADQAGVGDAPIFPPQGSSLYDTALKADALSVGSYEKAPHLETFGVVALRGKQNRSPDCEDTTGKQSPLLQELCQDGLDNDCDKKVDEQGCTSTYYTWQTSWDADGDGFYGETLGPEITQIFYSTNADAVLPLGQSDRGGDCAELDEHVSPEAGERCADQVDNDCDGDVDEDGLDFEGIRRPCQVLDLDDDGYSPAQGDCNDLDNTIHPNAEEWCDGVDENCDGLVDNTPKDGDAFYLDEDGDNFGADGADPVLACSCPVEDANSCEYVQRAGDCNDLDAGVHPDATEKVADGVDQDCDDYELCYLDQDGDEWLKTQDGTVVSADLSCDGPQESASNVKVGDCDDVNAAVHPDATETCNEIDDNCSGTIDEGVGPTWYKDADEDDYGVSTDTITACTKPKGYAAQAGDCDDTDAAVNPRSTEIAGDGVDQDCDNTETCYQDADDDGYRPDATSTVASSDTDCLDAQEAVSTDPTGDCNDTDATIKPSATETCNELDDNCSGAIDEGVQTPWYKDADNDGYGVSTDTITACTKPTGYAAQAGDCDDTSATIHPDAPEQCNGVDEDCNGTIDEGVTYSTWYQDADGDGYGNLAVTKSACSQPAGYVSNGTDCNDASGTTHPDAPEQCNGVDDNCNGTTDEGVTYSTWYRDADGDGYGNLAVTKSACSQPAGYVSNSTDCNDANAAVKPGATETCNGIDDDCDMAIDDNTGSTYYKDGDGDGYGAASSGSKKACTAPTGYSTSSSDCNDSDVNTFPGAAEKESTTSCRTDADKDGYGSTSPKTGATAGGDCNDSVSSINPGAAEKCDSVDNDCDGIVDDNTGSTYYKDVDGDGYGAASSGSTKTCSMPTGYSTSNSDCNDSDANTFPGAAEKESTTSCRTDADKDGYGSTSPKTGATAGGDCNDSVSSINPGAVEQCNSKDDDCDGIVDDNTGSTYYKDVDGDGYGSTTTTQACSKPTGYATVGGDCNDSSASTNPGATEKCDSVDNDCNGKVDSGCLYYDYSKTASTPLWGGGNGKGTSTFRADLPGTVNSADIVYIPWQIIGDTTTAYADLCWTFTVISSLAFEFVQISALTKEANSSSTWQVNSNTAQADGSSTSISCPLNTYIVGIRTHSGWYVDGVEAYCTSIENILSSTTYTSANTSRTKLLGADGWNGSAVDTDNFCPAGYVVTGLYGTYGAECCGGGCSSDHLYELGLNCTRVAEKP